MLLACHSACRACLDGHLGCHCPCCCINGIWYCPLLLRTPMSMGSPLHVMSTSSSLKTVMPALVNTDIVPLSEVLPTLINNIGSPGRCLLAHSHYLPRGFRPSSIKKRAIFRPTTHPPTALNPNYQGSRCLTLMSGQPMYPNAGAKIKRGIAV